MASAFQRQKVTGVFGAMDADGDGYLEEADFEALTARWMKVRDWEPGSAGYEQIRAVMMGWWEALREAADRDRDDRVTLDDVMAVIDQLRGMIEAVETTARSMFEAVDQDGDGRIGPAEYAQVVTAWKGYGASADGIFPLLDLDGDGSISQDEFVGLWTGFWIGDDPSSPSKWVFGPFEGDVSTR
jgi:Ca2+-binding EF-hand superfamily protein